MKSTPTFENLVQNSLNKTKSMEDSIENIDVSKYDSYSRYHAMNDFTVFVWCVFINSKLLRT